MSGRPLWLDLRAVPVQKRIGFLRAAREARVEAMLVAEDTMQGVDAPLVVATDDGALVRDGKTIGQLHVVRNAATAKKAAEADGLALIELDGWQVIPLETLVAARRDRPGTLFALARSAEQAGLFANVLQTGVHGIVLAPEKPGDLLEARRLLDASPVAAPVATSKASQAAGAMETATLTGLSDGGVAERACLDCTERFVPGQGLLVGATAASLVLVQAETLANDHIEARPFRVNAGAIHHYTLAADGTTRYLSELASGAVLQALDKGGKAEPRTVGRVKIERRPHTLVRWTSPTGPGHAFLQTAETVSLIAPDGSPRPVTSLQVGDRVLIWCAPAARHTGMAVDAQVVER